MDEYKLAQVDPSLLPCNEQLFLFSFTLILPLIWNFQILVAIGNWILTQNYPKLAFVADAHSLLPLVLFNWVFNIIYPAKPELCSLLAETICPDLFSVSPCKLGVNRTLLLMSLSTHDHVVCS